MHVILNDLCHLLASGQRPDFDGVECALISGYTSSFWREGCGVQIAVDEDLKDTHGSALLATAKRFSLHKLSTWTMLLVCFADGVGVATR